MSIYTFETFPSGLLEEILLATVVGYMPGILPYLPEWIDLKTPYLLK